MTEYDAMVLALLPAVVISVNPKSEEDENERLDVSGLP